MCPLVERVDSANKALYNHPNPNYFINLNVPNSVCLSVCSRFTPKLLNRLS